MKETSLIVNETHLGYIQTVISRMGQNSFQAKAWCITIISALIVFYLSQEDVIKPASIIIALAAVVLFGVLDVYYLYLERGYRQLYNLVAGIKQSDEVLKPYDMSIPKSERGIVRFLNAALSPSTGMFYLAIIILLLALWIFTGVKITPAV